MERYDFTKALIAVGICLASAGAGFAEETEWSYDELRGPGHWAELTPENLACAEGMQQSPIDISGEVSARIPEITIDWKPVGGTMVNNGHTIQVNLPSGSTLRRGEDLYELLQFHFHTPSEHHVHGKVYPLEAHFVFKSSVSSSLGVLAVFFEPGERDDTFAQLAAAFPGQQGEDVNVADADPNGLLPDSLDYWLYEGSLTTPPCSEDVDWMIAKTPVEVDPKDIASFTALYPMNARPIKLPHRRFILSSF